MLRKLPMGIQSFEQIRSGGYVYVDKTRPLAGMIDRGKSFSNREVRESFNRLVSAGAILSSSTRGGAASWS